MTQTPTASPAPFTIPVGQTVGMAERILTKLLAGVLAETGTSRPTYLAMQRLTGLGDGAGRDAYLADLGYWLELDAPDAEKLIDSLVADGLVTVPEGTVRLTAAGKDLLAKIRTAVGATTAKLYEPFDPADLQAAVTTLREITTRAQAML
jgi:DNA-binding MarR family transcriptional regulator